MIRKLLASDLDGTLFHPKMIRGVKTAIISREDCAAIREFRKQGHYFALCTGRTPNSIRRVLTEFPDLDPDGLILASGGALYEVIQRSPLEIRELESQWIPAQDAAEFVRYFHDTGMFTVYWTTRAVSYGLLERSPAHEKAHHLELISLEKWCSAPEDVISLGLTPISRHTGDALEAIRAIETHWPHSMRAFRNLIYIDISARAADKGKGIARLSELLGGKYRCYAVGDAHNDVPMFAHVGKDRSFLLANGEEDLVPMVRCKVGSVAECIRILLDGSF